MIFLGERASDGEPEAGTGSAFVDLIKAIENVRETFFGDNLAVVFYFEGFSRDSKRDFLVAVFDGVIEKDFDDFAEVGGIDFYGGFFFEVKRGF